MNGRFDFAHDMLFPTPRPPIALTLAVTLCLFAPRGGAQAPLNDAERARRDAEKVFNFIRFQTVRKAPAEGENKPPRPRRAAPVPTAPTAPTSPPAIAASAAAPAAPPSVTASVSPAPTLSPVEPAHASTPHHPTPEPEALPSGTAAALGASTAAEEPEDDEDDALKLVSFTAPQVSLELQATLGPSTRNVKVRFTVAADGRVTQAQAQEGTPRKLANVATQAIRQWRFAPLPRAREVDVEIAFKRD
jgi:protein TonB